MNINNNNIDELLTAYFLGELDESSRKEIELWIALSDDNRKQFEQTQQIWDASADIHIDFDENIAWDKVEGQIKQPNFVMKNWLSIAASIVLLLGLGAYFLWYSSAKPIVIYANNNFLPDTLTDGSTVRLNKSAQLSYLSDYNSKARELKLEGEAFFEVEKNPQKKFIVHMPSSRVEVLGTSFNIYATPNDSLVTVFVKTGVVSFSYLTNDSEEYENIRLIAGEKVVYNKYRKKIIKNTNKSYNQRDTYWVDKKITFDNTPLDEAVNLLEVIYNVEIVLANPEMRNCRVTVDFENNNIEQALAVIVSTFNFELHNNNNKIFTLDGEACTTH